MSPIVPSPPRTSPPAVVRPLVVAVVLAALLLAVGGQASAQFEEDPDRDPAHSALIDFALRQSQAFFTPSAFAHGLPADYVVLGRVDTFADSLSASVLLEPSVLLLTPGDALPEAVAQELGRLMPGGGRVFVLGGTDAIGPEVEARLVELGHQPERLAGSDRVATSIAVADAFVALGGDVSRVALARSSGPSPTAEWADAIAAAPWAAATGTPILLTSSGSLSPRLGEWFEANGVSETVLLGGEAALSAEVEAAVPAPRRIAGANRAGTAVAVAVDLWTVPSRTYRLIAGDHPLGWGYALSAVPLMAESANKVLLVGTDVVPAETDAFTCRRGERETTRAYGGVEVVSQRVRDALRADC